MIYNEEIMRTLFGTLSETPPILVIYHDMPGTLWVVDPHSNDHLAWAYSSPPQEGDTLIFSIDGSDHQFFFTEWKWRHPSERPEGLILSPYDEEEEEISGMTIEEFQAWVDALIQEVQREDLPCP